MVKYKREISDGIGASSGQSGGGQNVGISTRKIGGSGGGRVQQGQEQIEQEKKQDQRQAYLQRAAEARRQYEEQKQQARRAEELREESREPATRTGVYEKGGAVIQETTGKYETLTTLGKQQPGSRLVQRETGEYVLLTAKGLNLQEESTFGKIQENIGLEGGEKYYPTSEKTKTGTKYMARITEDLGVSGEDLSGAKYSPSYGLKYSVFLEDTLGGTKAKPAYQKTREAQPREIAEMISKGEIPPTFIGYKGGGARRQEVISSEQQGFKPPEVFPITYTTEEGKEIVTITGKSEGADYNIYGKPTTGYQINLEETITTKEPKKNIVQLAQESSPIYRVIGGRPSGVEESLKVAGKGFYQIGAEVGLMFVPPEISGIDDEKKRAELKENIQKVYPKELEPKATPLTNILEGKSPQTGYGTRYDIQSGATDVLLIASGIPYIEKIKDIKNIKNIPTILRSILSKEKPIPPPPPTPYLTSIKGSQFIVKQKVYKPGQYIDIRITKVPLGAGEGYVPPTPAVFNIKPVVPKPTTYFAYQKGGFEVTPFPLGKVGEEGIIRIEGTKKLANIKPIPDEPTTPERTQFGFPEEPKTYLAYQKGGFEVTPFPLGKAREIYRQEGTISFKRTVAREPTTPERTQFGFPEEPKTYLAYQKGGFEVTPFPLGKVGEEGIIRIEGTKKLSPRDLTPDEIESLLKTKGGTKLEYEYKTETFKGSPGKVVGGKFEEPKQPTLKLLEKPIIQEVEKPVLFMEAKESEKDLWKFKKIQLGISSKVLVISQGKTILDTISEPKTEAETTPSFYNKQLETRQRSLKGTITTIPYRQPKSKPTQIKQMMYSQTSPQISKQVEQKTISRQRLKTIPLVYRPTKPAEQKQRTKLKTLIGFPSPSAPLLTPLNTPIQSPLQEPIQDIPEVPREKPPKLQPFFPPRPTKERKTQAEKLGSTKEFLGNVPLGSIYGTYKRKEITYGDKKIRNLLGYERRGNKPKKRKAKKKEPFGISRKFRL